MKKILYWGVFPFVIIMLVLFLTLESLSAWCVELLNILGRWCYGIPDGKRCTGWYEDADNE